MLKGFFLNFDFLAYLSFFSLQVNQFIPSKIIIHQQPQSYLVDTPAYGLWIIDETISQNFTQLFD